MNKQKGFTLIEGLLLVLVISVLGFAGYYVWSQNKSDTEQTTISDVTTENKTETKDKTASWLLFESSKGWDMKIPDGWELITDTDSTGLTALSTLKYTEGELAIVTKTTSGRGGPFVLNTGNYAAGDPATSIPNNLNLTNESVFKAKNVEGKKYYGTLAEDAGIDGSKGDTNYWYVFVKDTKTVIFTHFQAKGQADIVTELEEALATLQFN